MVERKNFKDPRIKPLLDKAALFVKQENFRQAIEIWDKVLLIDPTFFDIWYIIADTYFYKLKQLTNALNYVNQALSVKSSRLAWQLKGFICYRIRNYQDAIFSLDQALSFDPQDDEALQTKALCLHEIKKYKEALESFDKAIELKPNEPTLYDDKSNTLIQLERYEEALETFKIALQVGGHLEPKERSEIILGKIIRIVTNCEDQQNFGAMYVWSNRGLKLSEEIGDELRQSNFLYSIANYFDQQQKYEVAYGYYTKAEEICPPNDPFWNELHITLVYFCDNIGRPSESDVYFGKINEDLFLKGKTGRMHYYKYLHIVAKKLGLSSRFDEAIRLIQEELLPKLYEDLRISSSGTDGEIFLESNYLSSELAETLQFFADLCWQKYRTQKKWTSESFELMNRSFEVLKDAQRFAESLNLTRVKMSILYQLSQYRLLFQESWINIDTINKKANISVIKEIIEDLHSCIKIGETLSNTKTVADANSLLGESLLILDYLNRRKKNQKDLRDFVMMKKNSVTRVSKLSEEYCKKALQLHDKISASSDISEIRINSSDYYDFQQSKNNLCFTLISNQKYEESLGYAESVKAREIFGHDTKKVRYLRCKERSELIDDLNRLDEQILNNQNDYNRLQKNIGYSEDSSLSAQLNVLESQGFSLFNQKRNIEELIWNSCPDAGITIPKIPRVIVTRFKEYCEKVASEYPTIKKWAALELEYLVNKEMIFFYLLDYEKGFILEGSSLSTFNWYHNFVKGISTFRKNMEKRSYQEAEKDLVSIASNIYKIIPSVITDRLKRSKVENLLLVADGILHTAPLELLKDESDTDDQCWGIKYGLVRGFSLNHFSSQFSEGSKTHISEKRGLIIGNPTNIAVPISELDPYVSSNNNSNVLRSLHLPGAEKEAKAISEMLGENCGKAILLLNNESSERNVIAKMNEAQYSFIHFAGHAKFDNINPDLSYLLLLDSQDKIEKLYANEISAKVTLIGSPIVCLSSCESGNAEIKSGNEAFGLIRALTLAGASNLILSGWNVFDSSAMDLMKIFYKNLIGGQLISDAIKSARLAILHETQKNTYVPELNALHWAPFQLWGSPFNSM